MTTTTRCATGAPHIDDAAADAEQIDWQLYNPDRGSFHSSLATCLNCSPSLIYDFGHYGGAYLTRRTNLDTGEVHVTPDAPIKTAAHWWVALTTGKAT